MRSRNILLGTLSIALVMATIGGVAYALHARTQKQADGSSYPGLRAPISVMCPGPTYSTNGLGLPYSADQGLPSIRPRNDCTPSFTQQDVRDYLAHGGRLSLGGIQITKQPTVTRFVFLTVGDLDRVGREHVELASNYPPDMLVCDAELSGTFSFSDPLGPPSPLSAVSIVFDAHTGNELVYVATALLG